MVCVTIGYIESVPYGVGEYGVAAPRATFESRLDTYFYVSYMKKLSVKIGHFNFLVSSSDMGLHVIHIPCNALQHDFARSDHWITIKITIKCDHSPGGSETS